MASSSYYNASGHVPVVVQGHVVNSQTAAIPAATEYHKPEKEPPRCRDVFWAILFYAHLAAMIACAAIYAPAMVNEVADNGGQRALGSFRFLEDEDGGGDGEGDEDLAVDPQAVLVILCIAGVLGFILSSLALGFMMTFAESLIKMALLFNICLFGLMALLSLLAGALPGALMLLFMFGFAIYYTWRVWSRIPFAASNLVCAVTAVRANMGLAFYGYSSLIVLFGWSLLWAVSTISTLYVTNGCNAEGECQSDVNPGILFLFLISYYWTIQVISNVVHVTTAGTVGTWWFAPSEANGCCSKAVRESYIRSITYSFGSICFGSLIVAIIQAVRELVNSARENQDSFLACCAECLIACIENLVEYFNKWAYVYVGLYGLSFREAGSNVMALFRSRGWTTIITDLMVDTVLFMVSVGVGILTAIVAVVIGAAFRLGQDGTLGVAFVLGFIIGYGMCATLFSVVSSAVNTVIVCYAEAPNEFQANHPKLSDRMRASWRQAWPTEFRY